MLFYCLKCRNNTEHKNPIIVKTKNGRIMLLSNCAVCKVKQQDLSNNKKLVDY